MRRLVSNLFLLWFNLYRVREVVVGRGNLLCFIEMLMLILMMVCGLVGLLMCSERILYILLFWLVFRFMSILLGYFSVIWEWLVLLIFLMILVMVSFVIIDS